MKLRHVSLVAAASVATLFSLAACSSDNTTPSGTGGASSGGAASGGASSGGATSGGKTGSGGTTASGGQGSGGLTGSGGHTSSGGQSSGGGSSGGANSGGQTSGGSSSGGANSGGQTSGGTGSGVAATFQTFKDMVQEKCGGQPCHNDPMNSFQMKWNDPMLYTVITTYKVTKCSNMVAINPGKPQESAIIKVLTGTCGMVERMPLGCADDNPGACVDADVIAAVTKWVMDGAKQ